MTVRVCARKFGGQFIGVNHPERKEQAGLYDLTRAMVKVGYSRWRDVFAGGFHRWFEIMGAVYETLAYVESVKSKLVATDIFWKLDASQKAVFSYRAGQALAKLVTESHLDVPWLDHVSHLVKRGVLRFNPNTRQRPDLIGPDWADNWHVVESKGRSNYPEKGLMRRAKAQAQAVVAVAGKAPATRCGCVSLLHRRPFAIEIEDPRGEPSRPIEVSVDEEGFFTTYYDIVEGMRLSGYPVERVSVETTEGRVEYQVVRIPETDVGVGVCSEIFNAYGTDARWRVLLSEIQSSLRTAARFGTQAENFSLGPDGIGVFDLDPSKGIKAPIVISGPSPDLLRSYLKKKERDSRGVQQRAAVRPLVVA